MKFPVRFRRLISALSTAPLIERSKYPPLEPVSPSAMLFPSNPTPNPNSPEASASILKLVAPLANVKPRPGFVETSAEIPIE